jgi:hypothetical protein
VSITFTLSDSNGNLIAYYTVELHATVITGKTVANGQVTFSNIEFGNHELVVFDKESNELGPST